MHSTAPFSREGPFKQKTVLLGDFSLGLRQLMGSALKWHTDDVLPTFSFSPAETFLISFHSLELFPKSVSQPMWMTLKWVKFIKQIVHCRKQSPNAHTPMHPSMCMCMYVCAHVPTDRVFVSPAVLSVVLLLLLLLLLLSFRGGGVDLFSGY